MRELLATPIEFESDESLHRLRLKTVRNAQFWGQVVRDEKRVIYASLIADTSEERPSAWRWARHFRI